MKYASLIVLASLLASQAHAVERDRSGFEVSATPFGVKQLKERIQLQGEIYIMDAAGKRPIFLGQESRTWKSGDGKGKLEINWGSSSNLHAPVNMKMLWTVTEAGGLHATIEQQDASGKKLRAQEFDVTDLTPVVWRSAADAEKRVIIRLTPQISHEEEPQALAHTPIGGKELMVVDNQGRLWADRVSLAGKYVALTTARGQVAFSYYPFKGATPIGVATGRRMELDLDNKLKLSLVSEDPLLPGDARAIVYGLYRPGKRTDSIRSLRSSTTDDEARLQKALAE
jgi:hypothetical protein